MTSAKSFDFFLVTAPGLEGAAFEELRLKTELMSRNLSTGWSYTGIQQIKGGVVFSTSSLEAGVALNYVLKIPTRILLRWGSFKATDFSALHKKLLKQEWTPYFRQGPLKVKVSTQGSRLKIKDRIELCAQESFQDAQKKSPLRKPLLDLEQTLIVRIENDQVELSVDTSGEALYKRGGEKWVGEAPIRETLAAALFFTLFREFELESRSATIVDPMCGSGTFLQESMEFFKINRRRPYAFQNFPSFKSISFAGWPAELLETAFAGKGSDLSAKAIEASEKNLRSYAQSVQLRQLALEKLKATDISADEPSSGCFVLSNPPYDYRIAADMEAVARGFEALFELEPVRGMGLVWPMSHWQLRPLKNKIKRSIKTRNGGLEVAFLIFSKH